MQKKYGHFWSFLKFSLSCCGLGLAFSFAEYNKFWPWNIWKERKPDLGVKSVGALMRRSKLLLNRMTTGSLFARIFKRKMNFSSLNPAVRLENFGILLHAFDRDYCQKLKELKDTQSLLKYVRFRDSRSAGISVAFQIGHEDHKLAEVIMSEFEDAVTHSFYRELFKHCVSIYCNPNNVITIPNDFSFEIVADVNHAPISGWVMDGEMGDIPFVAGLEFPNAPSEFFWETYGFNYYSGYRPQVQNSIKLIGHRTLMGLARVYYASLGEYMVNKWVPGLRLEFSSVVEELEIRKGLRTPPKTDDEGPGDPTDLK